MQLKKYPKKLTTLLFSTILLLTSVPVVSASEEPIDGEMETGEEEVRIDKQAPESEVMAISISQDEIITEGLDDELNNDEGSTDGDPIEPDTPEDFEEEDTGETEEPGAPENPEPEPAPEPAPEPEPEPEPEPNPEPVNPAPTPGEEQEEPEAPEEPVVPEPLPETTVEPILKPNPIEPNASTISGMANPGAHVIVIYPNTDKQRATTVHADGSWMIRNVGGDRAHLTEGSRVPMHLLVTDNEQELTYSYVFEVGDPSATDLIEESQTVYVPSSTETTSTRENPSSTSNDTYSEEDELELLPPTGEEDNLDVLAFGSIVSGMSLFLLNKKKKKRA